jgi:hypothetical protein
MRRTPLDFGEVSSSGEPLGPNLGGSLPSVKLQASTILGAFKKHLTRRTQIIFGFEPRSDLLDHFATIGIVY